MKKVLIALDYDPSSIKLAEKGYSLAKSMGAEVILMHVIFDPVYYSSTEYSPVMGFTNFMDMGAYQFDTVFGIKKAAQYFLDKTKHHLADESIQTIIEEGDAADSILDACKKEKADIIVMGTHSRKWLENILLGSVAESVLKHSTTPLFIIPTKKEAE